jgi:hypothetical protein
LNNSNDKRETPLLQWAWVHKGTRPGPAKATLPIWPFDPRAKAGDFPSHGVAGASPDKSGRLVGVGSRIKLEPRGSWTVARRSQTLGQGGPVDNGGARRSGCRAGGVPKAAVNSGRLMEEDAAEEMALTAAWPSAWAQGWC